MEGPDITYGGSHCVPSTNDEKRPKSKYVIMKLESTRGKEILKAFRKKTVTYKGSGMGMASGFLTETQEARQQWGRFFVFLKINYF